MRKYFLFLLVIGSVSARADIFSRMVSNVANDVVGKPYHGGIFRIAGGWGQSEVEDVNPGDDITEFDKGEGPWAEIELGMVVGFHVGFAQFKDKETSIDFNSGGLVNSETSLDRYQYGLRFHLPLKYVNPYIGGGVISGHMTMKDLINEQKEHSRYTGNYWNAGIDILFSPVVGIRLGYQRDRFKTRKYDILGNTPVEIGQHSAKAGLLFYF